MLHLLVFLVATVLAVIGFFAPTPERSAVLQRTAIFLMVSYIGLHLPSIAAP